MKTTRNFSVEDPSGKKARYADQEQDLALPLELWLMIAERLLSKADLQSLNRVCLQLHNLINEHYYLWLQLRWPEKDYDCIGSRLDLVVPGARLFELVTGDIAALLPSGAFMLLPVTGGEWVNFDGHLDPENFHIAQFIQTIVSLRYNQLATCAEDGIRIWNRLTGDLVQHLAPRHPQDRPFRLLCTGNGSLVSASSEGSLYLYPLGDVPESKLLFDCEEERGALIGIYFWDEAIFAEFESCLVSWNKFGREPVKRVDITKLQNNLHAQLRCMRADLKLASAGLVTDRDWDYFNHESNQEITFLWDFRFPGKWIEVIVNRTFCFLLDMFSDKSPVFLGVLSKRMGSCDVQQDCYIIRELTGNSYDALYDFDSAAGVFRGRAETRLVNPVKYYYAQVNGDAIFVFYDGRVMVWNIRSNQQTLQILDVPEVSLERLEMYEYGHLEWTFHRLMCKELLGMHTSGATIIWDVYTGRIKQHFVPDYLCDLDHVQYLLQMKNQNLLIGRCDEGLDDENGMELIPKQTHVCIYRFLQPQPKPKPSYAAVPDFDIMKPTPGR